MKLDEFWRTRLPPSKDTLYRYLDKVLSHKEALFGYLRAGQTHDHKNQKVTVKVSHRVYLVSSLSYWFHKNYYALALYLRGHWQDLFGVKFEVLLYDLTSTYFESSPPGSDEDKRRFGLRRDHRPDCIQVVIARVVTVEGSPLAYEVLADNTASSQDA